MSDVTPATLPGELAAQIARVSGVLQQWKMLHASNPIVMRGMTPTIALMQASLAEAIAAAGTPDIAHQMRSVKDLQGYDDA